MEVQQQLGFGAGVWEGQDQLEHAPNGTVKQADGMFVDAQGVLRARNGAAALQGTNFSAQRSIWAWEGQLGPGLRSLYGTNGSWLVVTSGLGVLDGSNNGVDVGANVGSGTGNRTPMTQALLDGILFIGLNTSNGGILCAYAGSLRNNSLSVNCTFTQGSPTVTGPGGAGGFSGVLDAGMLLGVVGTGQRLYVVASVDSNTQLTLRQPFQEASGTFGVDIRAFKQPVGIGSYKNGSRVATVAGRLLVLEGNKLYVSDGPDPATGASRAHSFPTKNVIEFSLDATGAALAVIRNQAFVFTAAGAYRVTGLEYEIVDPAGNPQWTIELLSREMVALSQASIATWHQALIVPCTDAIYMVDGVNPPQPLTTGVDWQKIVQADRALGQAGIYQGYYLLPVETSSGSQVYTTYVFRLQPVQTDRGLVFPNTRWLCDVAAYYSSSPTRLLMASPLKLWQGAGVFDPAAAAIGDAGAAVGTGKVTTRPFALGHGAVARRFRVRVARPAGTAVAAAAVRSADGSSVALTGDSAAATVGAEWLALEGSPAADPMPSLHYEYQGRFALLGAECQYRATRLPGGG